VRQWHVAVHCCRCVASHRVNYESSCRNLPERSMGVRGQRRFEMGERMDIQCSRRNVTPNVGKMVGDSHNLSTAQYRNVPSCLDSYRRRAVTCNVREDLLSLKIEETGFAITAGVGRHSPCCARADCGDALISWAISMSCALL
jgi:hypothetical protein